MAGNTVREKKVRQVLEKDIRKALTGKRPADLKIKDFTTLLSSFLGGASVSLFLFDSELGEFFLKSGPRTLLNGSGPSRHVAFRTILEQAMGEARIISLGETRLPKGSAARAEIHFFPLIVEEDVLGIVSVHHSSERGLSPVRLDGCRRLVNDFAAFIGKVRKSDSLALRMTRISAINEAGVTLISTVSLPDLLQMITSISALIMSAESTILRLCDEKTGEYTLRDFYGLKDGNRRAEVIALEQKAIEETRKTGKPLLIKDLSKSSRYRAFSDKVSSFISHPLTDRGKPMGSLTLLNKSIGNIMTPPYFTEDELENFSRLVRFVEKAVANALARQKQDELREHDEATGLPNAKYFKGRLIAEISRAQRFGSRIVIVTGRFQSESEEGSSPAGALSDEVFRFLADAAYEALREYDVVAKLDGATLGLILPQDEDGTLSPLSRVEETMEKALESPAGRELKISSVAEFSHATYPEHGEDLESLMKILDEGGADRETRTKWGGHELLFGALRGRELFTGLSEKQLRMVADIAELKMCKAGDYIFREGDRSRSVYVLQSGEVDIYKEEEGGKKIRLAALVDGAVFGEMALIEEEPRSATAVAGRDSGIIILEHSHLTDVFREDREIFALMALNIARVLSDRLRSSSQAYSTLYLGELLPGSHES